MALLPKLRAVYEKAERRFLVYDETGVYEAVNNPEGYGSPNIGRTDVANATLVVQQSKQAYLKIDVTTEVKDGGVSESVLLQEITPSTEPPDGVYRFFLIVSTDVDNYVSFGELCFINDLVAYYASQFWAKLASIYDIYKKRELETECIWIEGNLGILQSLKERKKESEYLNLLRFIQKRIDVNLSLIK